MSAPKGNQNAKGNKGGGAPSKYDAKFAVMAEKACKAGFTDIELADLIGVSVRTINTWKINHIEFSAALKVGKEEADHRVERSLFARANGYEHDAVKIFMPANAKAPVYAAFREYVPPDTTACIFWLKNRQPAKWRDKAEVEHSGNVSLHLSQTDANL